jgi:2-C-methyl-D-erythritol 4-phosphate cytidylyltransferase / 2-C-methyl-D-erythritol 2,4-cyclodiphosphate synthase
MVKSVIICAAGKSSRLLENIDIPKQYLQVCNKTILEFSIDKFLLNIKIDNIIVCVNNTHINYYSDIKNKYSKFDKIVFIEGGNSRSESVNKGLNYLKKSKTDIVFIHDAARPNFQEDLIDKLIDNLSTYDAIIPVTKITDTLKKVEENKLTTINRDNYVLSQTPQLFIYSKLLGAHKYTKSLEILQITDDSQVAELYNLKINKIYNTEENFKITTFDDYMRFQSQKEINNISTRVGIGFDVHKFKSGDSIKLFGIIIPHNKSLDGHSDADVGLHAITDAIYGALGLDDIGYYFNPNNLKWKDADSKIFLDDALKKLDDMFGQIINMDINVICEEPKINLYRSNIKNNLSKLLSISLSKISIKATTTEKLGFTGRKEGIAVQVLVNINIRSS